MDVNKLKEIQELFEGKKTLKDIREKAKQLYTQLDKKHETGVIDLAMIAIVVEELLLMVDDLAEHIDYLMKVGLPKNVSRVLNIPNKNKKGGQDGGKK